MYGKRKCHVKIRFVVDVRTKEDLAMDVTTDNKRDSKALPCLIMNASRHRTIIEAYMYVWMKLMIQ